jgi:hypothetical protein
MPSKDDPRSGICNAFDVSFRPISAVKNSGYWLVSGSTVVPSVAKLLVSLLFSPLIDPAAILFSFA